MNHLDRSTKRQRSPPKYTGAGQCSPRLQLPFQRKNTAGRIEPKPAPHATLTLMPPALRPDVETQSVPQPRDRPWLLAFLIAPDAVISLGLASGALTFLLRNEGVTPDRAASIAALIALPHAI